MEFTRRKVLAIGSGTLAAASLTGLPAFASKADDMIMELTANPAPVAAPAPAAAPAPPPTGPAASIVDAAKIVTSSPPCSVKPSRDGSLSAVLRQSTSATRACRNPVGFMTSHFV